MHMGGFNSDIVECKGWHIEPRKQAGRSFNSDIVECKDSHKVILPLLNIRFNSDIVECKGYRVVKSDLTTDVLIAT